MPYFAPLAAMPTSSSAPRLAEMNAKPVTQAGSADAAIYRCVVTNAFGDGEWQFTAELTTYLIRIDVDDAEVKPYFELGRVVELHAREFL